MNVTVYGRKTCAPCKTVKKWLNSKSILFTEKDVDETPGALAEIIRMTGQMTVPVTLVGGVAVSGPNFGMLTALLTNKP